ncbi:MAG: hypothetical protein EOP83_00265 [Verrucomicrobiaceae bacterium]|nr:MAG: hypothetical protein EOP83_00265 [Verrucomicrobiaceae bacterium]
MHPLGSRLTLEQVRENTEAEIDRMAMESMRKVWKHVFIVRKAMRRGEQYAIQNWLEERCPDHHFYDFCVGIDSDSTAFEFKMRWM